MHFSPALIQQFLDSYGYIAVLIFVAIESSGIPFPGETMLITAGAYAGAGHLQIPLVIGSAAIGAIAGDNIGYIAGRTGGRELVLRYGKYVRLNPSTLEVAERFFQRHGDKTVFFGRFIAVLRAWAAFLAGVNRMPWHRFVLFNAAGGICWATLYGILAFELGKNLPLLEKVVRAIGIAGVVLAVGFAVTVFILHRRGHLRIPRAKMPAEADAERDDASLS
jgi:membrane protein DedA with SNARE-associated domain